MEKLSAIPIRYPWIDLILRGLKTWEIRSKFTKKIGPVALIRAGSKTVVATATLSEVIKLSPKMAIENASKMGMKKLTQEMAEGVDGQYAWVLTDVVPFKNPVPYVHGSGPVVWVTLDEPTTKKVLEEAKRSKMK